VPPCARPPPSCEMPAGHPRRGECPPPPLPQRRRRLQAPLPKAARMRAHAHHHDIHQTYIWQRLPTSVHGLLDEVCHLPHATGASQP